MLRVLPIVDSARFRLSPVVADGDESLLAASDKVAIASARGRLVDVFDGFRLEEFDQCMDDARFAVFGVSMDFLGCLDFTSRLDSVLRDLDAAEPVLKLADGTRRYPIDGYSDFIRARVDETMPSGLRPFGAAHGLSHGVTIILNDYSRKERAHLARFADDISRVRAVPTQINVYLSETDALGFGVHWDDHDVVIIQCAGRKHWEVFEPGVLSPLLNYVDRDVCGESFLSVVLEPGMGIFIPRGWPHRASGLERELSAHLTVGMRRVSFQDVVAEHLKTLDHDVLGRWVSDADGLPVPRLEPADLEHAVGRVRASYEPVPLVGPIGALGAVRSGFGGVPLSLNLPGGLVFVDHPIVAEQEVAIAAGDSCTAIDRSMVPVLAMLLRGEGVTLDDLRLSTSVGSDQLVEFLGGLARQDMLHTVS